MKITSNNKTELNTVEVEFQVDAEDLESAVQVAFLKKRKNIMIPGFRKGKATRKMIEANYGEAVFYEEAVNELYKNFMPKVIDELKLEIVDAPNVEVTELSKENGVSFKVTLTVKPEVEISDYIGVEVELEPLDVTDADIDAQIETIRSDNARIIDASDVPVAAGDIIKFDFEGFCDGAPFEGGTAADFELEIGSGQFIPGFEEQIVGKNVGEPFDVNVTFPDDYFSETVRGKDVTFKCKIHEKSAKEIAEFDDEFVKDISEFDTVEEFRNDLSGKIAENNEKVRDMDLEREIAEKVVELMKADIPPIMFDDRTDELAREWAFKYNMRPDEFAKQSGMTYEKYREGFREIAEKQVKFRLALEKIAVIEDIKVTKEEIDEEYDKMTTENYMPLEKVKQIVSEAGVEQDIKTEKALKLIKDSAKIKYKKATKKAVKTTTKKEA